MLVEHLHAVPSLAVNRVGFAPVCVSNSGFCHQVALITAIDKYFGRYFYLDFVVVTFFQCNVLDGIAFFLCFCDSVAVQNVYVSFFYVFVVHAERGLWFECVLGFVFTIIFANAFIEVQGISFNRFNVSDVGLAQSAGCQSSNALGRLDKQHAFALFFCSIGSHYSGRRSSVYTNIYIVALGISCLFFQTA